MKSRVMINKNDGATFDKGDVVTIQDEGCSFGANIDSNGKFKILTIDGLSVQDIEVLKEPLYVFEDGDFVHIKPRKYHTDVDSIVVNEMLADDFMDLLSIKTVEKDIQTQDVIV